LVMAGRADATLARHPATLGGGGVPETESPGVLRKIASVAADDIQYTGRKLSLDFQDIEIRSVLQLIADFTDTNLVVSDTVQGKVTLRLQDVPWDQALDLILRTRGLGK